MKKTQAGLATDFLIGKFQWLEIYKVDSTLDFSFVPSHEKTLKAVRIAKTSESDDLTSRHTSDRPSDPISDKGLRSNILCDIRSNISLSTSDLLSDITITSHRIQHPI